MKTKGIKRRGSSPPPGSEKANWQDPKKSDSEAPVGPQPRWSPPAPSLSHTTPSQALQVQDKALGWGEGDGEGSCGKREDPHYLSGKLSRGQSPYGHTLLASPGPSSFQARGHRGRAATPNVSSFMSSSSPHHAPHSWGNLHLSGALLPPCQRLAGPSPALPRGPTAIIRTPPGASSHARPGQGQSQAAGPILRVS